MSGVVYKKITADEDGMRLDKWFKKHFPDVPHGHLEKVIRKGEVRLDKKRCKSKDKVVKGQEVRVPPFQAVLNKKAKNKVPPKLLDEIKKSILFEDDDILVMNKPKGLAVQGGSKVDVSVDDFLKSSYFKNPAHIVHRIDKDTSGILLVAKNRQTAKDLTFKFQQREVHKTYWAVVVGEVPSNEGEIDLPLLNNGQKVVVDETGQKALTQYRLIEKMGKLRLLELDAITGRKHQIRVHCMECGFPILGDGKYAGRIAHPQIIPDVERFDLHLHARRISFKHPKTDKDITFEAPLSGQMKKTWEFFGLVA